MDFLFAKRVWFGLAVLAISGLGACSHKDPSDLVFQEIPAEKLYAEGLLAMETGDRKEAKKKFDELDRQHPYSDYSRRSMMLTAYTHYKSGEYTECISAAKRFIALFPGDKDVPYAYYLIGQSYFNQIPDVTRDQETTQKALQAMNELVQNYPDSEYAGDARRKVRVTLDQLAGKEMQVGRYYLERKEYIAAINRFKVVVTDYQTTRQVEEALMRLAESYLALGITHEAQTAVAVLGHNYPESKWYKMAYSMLNKGGYEPEVNKGSWMARIFN
nr:outer membrane protein assembly factor BamD [uncultured Cohaesibacter sp.]